MKPFKSSIFLPVFALMGTLFFSIAHASVLEGALHLPWTFIENNLQNRLPASSQASIRDLALNAGEWTPRITRANVDWGWSTANLHVRQTQLRWSSSTARATIDIERLVFDQYVTREFGGSPMRIRVQASCGPIRLVQAQGDAEITGQLVQLGTWFEPRVNAVRLGWQKPWEISDFSCEGPAGILPLVKDSFAAALRDPSTAEAFLLEHLGQEAARAWTAASREIRQSLRLGEGSEREIQLIGLRSLGTSGLWLNLELRGFGGGDARHSFHEPGDVTRLPLDEPVMLWTDEGVSSVIEKSLAVLPEQTLNVREVDGFMRLLNSRFIQFFVWPDLWNFKKSARFLIRVKSESPQVSSADGEKWNARFVHRGVLRAERDGALHDYIRLSGRSSSTWSLRSESNALTLRLTGFSSVWNWGLDADYVRRYNPNRYIAKDRVDQAVSEWQPSFSFRFEAPRLRVGENEEWIPRKWAKLPSGHWAITWALDRP